MTRIALIPSEPIRPRMAGAGIRYFELARRLPAHGFEVVLLTPGELSEVPHDELRGVDVRRFRSRHLDEILADCDVAVAQGQLANDLLHEVPALPCVIDLHDPFLAENLHYARGLGLKPFLNDHATWVHQLARGDFFLCASQEQRDYYLGFLTALGRVHPTRVSWDPDLERLIAVASFAVPEELPPHRPLLPERAPGERRLLFGGLYDWYDPWPVLRALEVLHEPSWNLLFIRHPNPEDTPQRLLAEVEAWCRERGWWEERVRVIDWVPASRRFDLWRDVDALVACHSYTLEARLSLRIRFLDALAAGCPVISNEGGAISRLLLQHRAGWVVPRDDVDALAHAVRTCLAGGETLKARAAGARELLAGFTWSRLLEPIVAFCRSPAIDPDRGELAVRLPAVIPPDALRFRIRRLLFRIVHLQLNWGVKRRLRQLLGRATSSRAQR